MKADDECALFPAYKAKFLNAESLSAFLDVEFDLLSFGLVGGGEGELFMWSLAIRLLAIEDEEAEEEDGGEEADDDMLFASLFNISSLENLCFVGLFAKVIYF